MCMCMCVSRSLILGEMIMMMILMLVMVMTNWLLLSPTLPTYPTLHAPVEWQDGRVAEVGGRVR